MRLNFFNRIFLLSAAILFVLCACGTDSNKDADITEKAEIPNIESSSESSSSQHDNGVSADTGFIEENELNASAAEDGGDGWAEAEGGIADEQSSDGEQPENTAAEYALAVGNMANDKAGMDFQPINEMLMKQKQEELIQAEKEKMKKSGAKKENSGRNEPGAGGGEDYSGKTSGVNKPKLRHIGLKDLFSSSGMPSLFGSADKGRYFLFDIRPELATQKKLGDINIKAFAESKKRQAERRYEDRKRLQLRTFKSRLPANKAVKPYSEITEDNLCSVCLQHRDAQGRGHTGFYDHKIIVMRLKPGCPMPSPEEGLLGVWEGPVDSPSIIIEEYDCTKKVPVPEDMCTGWIKRYVCK